MSFQRESGARAPGGVCVWNAQRQQQNTRIRLVRASLREEMFRICLLLRVSPAPGVPGRQHIPLPTVPRRTARMENL